MDLKHQFRVPAGVDDTWARFQDIAGLAGCFPGAQVTSVEDNEFTGSCKVKLGPIALVYTGTGTFTERDESAHRLVVEAKGRDKRGNGTAAASATVVMSEAADGGTDVEVVTELTVTGKPAQFGRGLIQDVSDKLLGQFVDCLAQQFTASDPVDEGSAPEATTSSEPATASAAAPAAATRPAVTRTAAAPPAQPEALDLGATVLPVLIKNRWVQAVAGAVALAIVIRLIRRR